LFPPERLASLPTDSLRDACPSCGGHLLLTDDPPIVVQQVDIATPPLEIHEHRSHPGWCPHCQKECYAPFPLPIERGGLAGTRLTTIIAYLKGSCPASDSTIRKFVREGIGLTISRGPLAKIIGKVSRALEHMICACLPEGNSPTVSVATHAPRRTLHGGRLPRRARSKMRTVGGS
jgi:hypothetical protein